MKETNICPKCRSTDVVRIPTHKSTSSSNVVYLNIWGTLYFFFDRYLCISCGFMESYAKLEEKGLQKWIEKQKEEKSFDSDFV